MGLSTVSSSKVDFGQRSTVAIAAIRTANRITNSIVLPLVFTFKSIVLVFIANVNAILLICAVLRNNKLSTQSKQSDPVVQAIAVDR